MERTKSTKIKIISLVASLLICFALIGVGVWAAVSQKLTIDNNITITTSRQTKVAVTVSEYINASTDAVSAAPQDEISSSWTEKVTKDAETDTATGSVSPINFNLTEGKNYYAYKFEFTNSSDNMAYAHISASAVNNEQITIYYGETWGATMQALGNNVALDQDVDLAATNGTGEFYIVVASKAPLEELKAVEDPIAFNITVTLDQLA